SGSMVTGSSVPVFRTVTVTGSPVSVTGTSPKSAVEGSTSSSRTSALPISSTSAIRSGPSVTVMAVSNAPAVEGSNVKVRVHAPDGGNVKGGSPQVPCAMANGSSGSPISLTRTGAVPALTTLTVRAPLDSP